MAEHRYNEMLNNARDSVEYWAESAIADFTEEIVRLMAEKNVSRAELARSINSSQAYITKVLRGKANFTVVTMTKLARALGTAVRIHLAPENVIVHWEDEHITTDSESDVLMEDYIQYKALLDVRTDSEDHEYEPQYANAMDYNDRIEAIA